MLQISHSRHALSLQSRGAHACASGPEPPPPRLQARGDRSASCRPAYGSLDSTSGAAAPATARPPA
eukprot:5171231-Prymnesium_polylepis.1